MSENNEIKKYKYKFIGKSLHPNKEQEVFDLCDEYMNHSEYKPSNVDWQILGEQCATVSVMNNHTFEIFECEIQDL